jgi:hypothetical protein
MTDHSLPPVRRIITGTNSAGRSCIVVRCSPARDILIQRGTHHAWANRSQAIARIAFVLIGSERF